MNLRQDENGWWWPAEDRQVSRITPREVLRIPLYMAHVPKDRRVVCIQAGGNSGMFAKALSPFFREVRTFEPDPINYECLRRNIGNSPGIQYRNSALSNDTVPVETFFPAKEVGNFGAIQVRHGGKIPSVLIDNLDLLDGLDLLMLDVEGYEHKALLGAEKTVRMWRPTIAVELKGLGVPYGYPDEDTRELLRSWGYEKVNLIGRDEVWTWPY